LWVPADIERTPEQRVVEAAARLPAHGGVTGWAALRWLGGRWFEGTREQELLPVTLALGSRRSLRAGRSHAISQELVPAGDIVRDSGLRVTNALWSVAFEMRKAPREVDAIVAFEMAAYDDLVSIAELSAYVDSALWLRQGVPRVRDLLSRLDENSWSPMEPHMRCAWCGAGFPRPLANRPVFDRSGRFVGTPDLIDLTNGVYGMYDGGLHLAGHVRSGDVEKESAYRALGLEGAIMMAGDVGDPGAFQARLRGAYERAARRPVADRGWLLECPDWWVPTFTVEQRRALSAYDATRFLRYRRAS
jgi:hypothetical protein